MLSGKTLGVSPRLAGTHGAQQTTASKAGAITPPRIAFVSAIIGGYERTTKPVANQTVPVDCIVYSDRADLETHGIWRIIDTERYRLGINATDASPAYNNSLSNNTHTFNRAKFFKLNLHRLPELAQYDIVVWLDGTVEVTSPNAAATLVWLLRARGAAIVTFDHPHRIYWTDEVVVSTRSAMGRGAQLTLLPATFSQPTPATTSSGISPKSAPLRPNCRSQIHFHFSMEPDPALPRCVLPGSSGTCRWL